MNSYIKILKRAIIDEMPSDLKEKFIDNKLSDDDIAKILREPLSIEQPLSNVFCTNGESMIWYTRMSNVQSLLTEVIEKNIYGDVIEAGVWRGGTCIFMRALLKHFNSDKKVFAADSFKGMPQGTPLHGEEALIVSLDAVKSNFEKYKLLDEQVVFLEGWVEETLPTLSVDQRFCLLRLDLDFYEATMTALENLYKKLSYGGYVIIDDYWVHDCKRAVNDYRRENNITDKIEKIDWTGAYWQKQQHYD